MKNLKELEIDLFEDIKSLPDEIQAIIEKMSDEHENGGNAYLTCQKYEVILKSKGYTFEWGLCGEPYNLKKL